jgi:hypothetical protein
MKQHLIRLEQVAGELNAWPLAIAIGLAVLDFTVLVAKCLPPLPTATAAIGADSSRQTIENPSIAVLTLTKGGRHPHCCWTRRRDWGGGFGFDLWTPAEGLSRGFSYRRIEDAYYARKVEIRSRTKNPVGRIMACTTLDEFASALTVGSTSGLGRASRALDFD